MWGQRAKGSLSFAEVGPKFFPFQFFILVSLLTAALFEPFPVLHPIDKIGNIGTCVSTRSFYHFFSKNIPPNSAHRDVQLE